MVGCSTASFHKTLLTSSLAYISSFLMRRKWFELTNRAHFCLSNWCDAVIPPEDSDELPIRYSEKMYRFIPLLYVHTQENVKHNSDDSQGKFCPSGLLEG